MILRKFLEYFKFYGPRNANIKPERFTDDYFDYLFQHRNNFNTPDFLRDVPNFFARHPDESEWDRTQEAIIVGTICLIDLFVVTRSFIPLSLSTRIKDFILDFYKEGFWDILNIYLVTEQLALLNSLNAKFPDNILIYIPFFIELLVATLETMNDEELAELRNTILKHFRALQEINIPLFNDNANNLIHRLRNMITGQEDVEQNNQAHIELLPQHAGVLFMANNVPADNRNNDEDEVYHLADDKDEVYYLADDTPFSQRNNAVQERTRM